MRIGLFLGQARGDDAIERLVRRAQAAETDGFDRVWIPNGLGLEAVTVATVVGRATDAIGVGSAVVPSYPRHPIVMAQQALTAQQATKGRFALGLGVSHRNTIEQTFGYSYDRPARHMREYLAALVPLLHGEHVSMTGETVTVKGRVEIDTAAPPLLLAAMGPAMLELAGAVADGTITWMTGQATLQSHVIPRIRTAAESVDRPDPIVVAALPVCVTDDPPRSREEANAALAMYTEFPSYRAMLDREGAGSPADIAIIGDEDHVRSGIARVAELGVAELMVVPFWSRDDADRTRALVRALPRLDAESPQRADESQ